MALWRATPSCVEVRVHPPFGDRHFLLRLGGHGVELSGEQGVHLLGHLHVLLLQLLDVLHQLQDAGGLGTGEGRGNVLVWRPF